MIDSEISVGSHEKASNTVGIKPLTLDDAEQYFKLIQFDPEHLRQFGDVTADKYPDIQSVEHGIINQPDTTHRFGIWTEDKDNVMVGLVKLEELRQGCYEAGYWVGKEFVGNGYARQALTEIDDYAFNSLEAKQVEAHVVVGNVASRKTLEAAGYEFAYEQDGLWIFMKGQV